MLTRKFANRRTALAAGLIAGLAGQAASATEVVIAYGDAIAQRARAFDAEFKARMDQSAHDVGLEVRANVEREVIRIRKAPVVQIALTDAATRG